MPDDRFRPLVLCADDFGLSPAVDDGILELCGLGRLSAVSCIVVTPEWAAEARRLRAFDGRIDVGLHVTLTGLAPLGPLPRLAPSGRLPELGELLQAALLRRIERTEVANELERQLDAFVAGFGRLPDFVDGHQHVHGLPGIREAVVDLFVLRLDRRRAYLRSCHEPLGAIARRGVDVARAALVSRLSVRLRRAARQREIATNDSFRGVNAFSAQEDVRAMFRRFWTGEGERPLVMCHPGRVDSVLRERDAVYDRRLDELAYLAGPAVLDDLAAAGRRLARFAI